MLYLCAIRSGYSYVIRKEEIAAVAARTTVRTAHSMSDPACFFSYDFRLLITLLATEKSGAIARGRATRMRFPIALETGNCQSLQTHRAIASSGTMDDTWTLEPESELRFEVGFDS